jgi:hypothetical protein
MFLLQIPKTLSREGMQHTRKQNTGVVRNIYLLFGNDIQQPLLGNFFVNNGCCQVVTATDTRETTEELLEAMFSVRSVPRLYNK